ncbi:hypothetical protein [Pedobacter zeae]|uniref:Immunity protein 49 n=1 Tax=Pedobacter zeae TaxID=1737356 RepID=A0A7W6KEY0_9SPHI|nr:hypothetical protein [Pedobacter zeae]MBB4109292.1 hypothetical protein [Pedobacter zeae]GGH11485.1 hypothetical protein GCM10007422_30700 [Pedobacter zeae]
MYSTKEFKIFFQKVLKSSQDEEPFIKEFIEDFLHKNARTFQKKMVVWDEEEVVDYDLLYVLSSYSYRFKIPEGILNLIEKNNEDAFVVLLKSYFTDLLVQTYAYKTNQFVNSVLHTDLALSTLLSLGYFPDKTEVLAKHLSNFLESNKAKLEIYPQNLDFGFKSTLYLTSVLLHNAGYSTISKEINHHLKPTDEAYEFAGKNLYATDSLVVNKWVNELADFHIANSKDDLTRPFNRERWQYFPIEIITLLQLRSQQGLPIDFITHPLLKDFLPFIAQKLPVPLDETTQKLEKRILEK